MAQHGADYSRGHMDISEQTASFDMFVRFSKWGSLAVAVLVLFATLNFCTETGFIGSAISALIVLAVGIAVLREKPEAAH
jgi:hypothetical protein